MVTARQEKSALFKAKIIEMYEAGIPCKEMAEKLNCTESNIGVSVHRLVKQGKLKLRLQFRRKGAKSPKLPRINEAAKQLGVFVDTLRRWEAMGLVVPVRIPSWRNSCSGHRRYDIEEIRKNLANLLEL